MRDGQLFRSLGDHNTMKEHVAAIESQSDAIRAGVISALIFALCYLYATGLSGLPRIGAFVVLFAVCFVLMMGSVVDLLVWLVGLASRYCGMGPGHAVRLLR